MTLRSSAIICKVCGRLQKNAFTVVLPIIAVVIIVGVLALNKYLPQEITAVDNNSQTATSSVSLKSTGGYNNDTNNSSSKNNVSDKDKSKLENSQSIQSSVESASADGIEIDKNGKDVEIIVPIDILTLGSDDENATIQLTDEMISVLKQEGFKDVEQLADGSLKYTITKNNYKKYIDDLRKSTAETINSLYNNETFPSVKNITYNDDFSKVNLIVDKEEYESGFDGLITLSIAFAGRMYQAFDVDASQKVVIDIVDNVTGDIFNTITYPDILQ